MNETTIFYVYLSKGRVLLIGDSLENDEHRHHALQITINLEPSEFTLRRNSGDLATQGVVIRPNAPHHVVSSDSWRAVLLLDAQAQQSQQIRQRFLTAASISNLPPEDLHFCREHLQDFQGQAQPITVADRAISAIVDRLAGRVLYPEIHPRVERALAYIHSPEGAAMTLNQLAERVFLSESRLSHLFKTEIGIPIQRYLLWYKVMQTTFNIGRGMSFIDASEAAGFADSAHFSRTFRAMFGMTPSQVLKRGQHVKIISDLT